MTDANARFVGSIPEAYHRYLGPLFFQPYADDLARRVAVHAPQSVLEVACGTGIVTAALAAALPGASIVATDLNDSMIDFARGVVPPSSRLTWRQADACALPFDDGVFDAVACQFGLMFVPNKALALREARRVLRPGGWLHFSVWDALDANPSDVVTRDVMIALFPDNPPTFYDVPFGMHDRTMLGRLFTEVGFQAIALDTVRLEARAASAHHAATGLVTGCPAVTDLQGRGVTDLTPIIDAVASAIGSVGGMAPFQVPMQAIVISARA